MIERTTIFSPCRLYRYTLWREWLMEGGLHDHRFVQFIGLNPSTADETLDDPTIRRCKQFAMDMGYNAMCMTNLFAWRDKSPAEMKKIPNPVGEDNDKHLLEIAGEASLIIAAWGTHGKHMYRALAVKRLIPKLHCLRKTKDGHPEHPLYLPQTLRPIPL